MCSAPFPCWLTLNHGRYCQTTELSRRIKDAEKAVKRLVTEEYIENGNGEGQSSQNGHHHTHSTDAEAQQRRHGISQDGGSDDDDTEDELDSEDVHSLDALEDQFLILEEEVATLVADVHDLALYTKLNITGFMKILKVCRECIHAVMKRLPVLSRNMMYARSACLSYDYH